MRNRVSVSSVSRFRRVFLVGLFPVWVGLFVVGWLLSRV